VAGVAGELLRRDRRSLHDRRDLAKRHGEHVVQHERDPFGRVQGVQHDQQRPADRIGQNRLVFRVAPRARLRQLVEYLPGQVLPS
jgi:hypothetical protein